MFLLVTETKRTTTHCVTQRKSYDMLTALLTALRNGRLVYNMFTKLLYISIEMRHIWDIFSSSTTYALTHWSSVSIGISTASCNCSIYSASQTLLLQLLLLQILLLRQFCSSKLQNNKSKQCLNPGDSWIGSDWERCSRRWLQSRLPDFLKQRPWSHATYKKPRLSKQVGHTRTRQHLDSLRPSRGFHVIQRCRRRRHNLLRINCFSSTAFTVTLLFSRTRSMESFESKWNVSFSCYGTWCWARHVW